MTVECVVVADGYRFIATTSGKTYRSLNLHRSEGWQHKSIWSESVSRQEEFALFDAADRDEWQDSRGYWGFQGDTAPTIGTRNERMAHFPHKTDSADDWHGFPVHITVARRPEKGLVEKWHHEGRISFAVAKKLRRGKL